MSILKKIKKKNELLSDIELKEYEKELYLLQDKAINITSRGNPTKKDFQELLTIGKRIKTIKKILKEANKKCLKQEKKNIN